MKIQFFLIAFTTNILFAEGNAERFILFTQEDAQLAQSHSKHSVEVIKKLSHSKAFVVRGTRESMESLAHEMQAKFEVDAIFSIPQVSLRGKPSGGGGAQPAQSIPWGILKVRAREVATRGAGITVCVSDTGIDLSHPDLATNILSGFNTINPSKSATDDNGHGTHVAGTIAAIDNTIGVVGVAPEAKLIAAKGLNRNGSGYSSDLAETIDGCRDRGAHIINMSWGSTLPSTVIQDALIRAESAGILLIAAAGNNGGSVGYPAAFPQVVAVSATDANDLLATFSSRGPEVENSAPGVSIYSTYKGGTYRTLNGTSMASPHVAGVAALMLSVLPGSSRHHLFGDDIGLPVEHQGSRGRINAVLSTTP